MANTIGAEAVIGAAERSERISRLRNMWNGTSIQFKLLFGASLLAAGLTALPLVAGSDGETVVPSGDPAPSLTNESVVFPDAETTVVDCSPRGQAVAAYMGRQATMTLNAACNPTDFAASVLAANR